MNRPRLLLLLLYVPVAASAAVCWIGGLALGRLDPAVVARWVCATAVGLLLSSPWLLRTPGKRNFRTVAVWFTFAAPSASVVLSYLVFGLSKAHPLMQYNPEGAAGAQGWAVAWPLLLLSTSASVVMSMGLALARGRETWLGRGRWLLLALVNGMALPPLMGNFPSV